MMNNQWDLIAPTEAKEGASVSLTHHNVLVWLHQYNPLPFLKLEDELSKNFTVWSLKWKVIRRYVETELFKASLAGCLLNEL